MVQHRLERPGSCGYHSLITTTDARACRLMIPDPSRPGPTHPRRPPPASRDPVPARLPCHRPRSANRPWPPPPAHSHPCQGRGRRPPRRSRPLGRPGGGHHPPDPGPSGPRGPGRRIGAWLADRDRTGRRRRALAVDGKTLRGARCDGRQVHLLAAMDHATRAVLAQRQADGAPGEVPGVQPLLADLDLDGVVVTADALSRYRDNASWGYPFKRSSLGRWIVLVPVCTTRGPWASSRPGFGPMWTAWTTWSGCAGLLASSASAAATPGAGGWAMAGSSAPGARPARRRRRARSLTGRARR